MDEWFSVTDMVRFIPILLAFLPVTLQIFFSAALLGCLGGVALALARVYRVPVLRGVAAFMVSYTRGVPILVQLMLTYYIMPGFLTALDLPGADLPAIGFVITAYGLYMAANCSEILRGAIGSIPHGQIDAAFSLGMTSRQILCRIIGPQALLVAMPDLGTLLLVGLKSTALAFSVGIMDMVGRGQALGAQTMRSFEVFLALSLIYYALTLLFETGFRRIEKYLAGNRGS
jgi:L-cystine transport system permease protein